MLRSPTYDPSPPLGRRGISARTVPWEALAMVLVAFAMRALYAWVTHPRLGAPAPGEAELDALAWNLARGLGFRLEGAAGLPAAAAHPPALPYLTSLLYRLTGHDFFASLMLQCAAGALLPVALAGFVRATWGSRAARLAGWIAAVNPLLVVSCGTLAPGPLFALTLLLALSASADWIKTPRPGRALGTGLVWGLAILTRPDALLLPPLVAAWSWYPLGLSLASRDRLRQAALLLFGVALAVGPWTLRSARELHAFVPVATGVGGAALHTIDPRLALAWSILALPPALFGAFTMLASPKRLFLALPLLTIAALTANAFAHHGAPGVRVPVEPLVALHAAVGADELWNRWRRRRSGLALVPRRG